jgi:hypothetical protein
MDERCTVDILNAVNEESRAEEHDSPVPVVVHEVLDTGVDCLLELPFINRHRQDTDIVTVHDGTEYPFIERDREVSRHIEDFPRLVRDRILRPSKTLERGEIERILKRLFQSFLHPNDMFSTVPLNTSNVTSASSLEYWRPSQLTRSVSTSILRQFSRRKDLVYTRLLEEHQDKHE